MVEVVLALAVISCCFSAILGLISMGLRTAKESEDEIRAANLASAFICRMRSAPNVDLTAIGFPFGVLTTSSSTAQLFSVTPSAPFYVKGDGTRANAPADAMTSRGFALAADGTYDLTNQVARVSLTLWWPPTATLSSAAGQYTITTFIDTETP